MEPNVYEEIKHYRNIMDECWMELETARSWEAISDISGRLSDAGLKYKHFKAMRDGLI